MDDKNKENSEYIGDVIKPKVRKYRGYEKAIAAVTVVVFIFLVLVSSMFMIQDAERAINGNVELEYPIGDGENAAANAERFSDAANDGCFLFGDDIDNGNISNENDGGDVSAIDIANVNSTNSDIVVDTPTPLS